MGMLVVLFVLVMGERAVVRDGWMEGAIWRIDDCEEVRGEEGVWGDDC